MIKTYTDQIPPASGREYNITDTTGGKKRITDVTAYEQAGSGFGTADVMSGCIIEVTHSKSGTVHTLTTANTQAENLKFTATADFTAGDTIKFNSTTLTVKCVGGSTPATGLFKNGDVVECSKSGNGLFFIPMGYSKSEVDTLLNAKLNKTDTVKVVISSTAPADTSVLWIVP